jgi:ABC-type branched-subunit amino acid transport system ATPase component/ABC-type branched-subunit amino acid transport system permease subunit
VIEQTGAAVRGAWVDARGSWSRPAWIALAALAAAALVPFVLPGSVRMDGLAETVYLAVAAVGLGFAVGIGGMPSVAQGAFVGVGAVGAAHLAGSDWPPVAAAVAGAVLAGLAGIALGAAIVRFRPVYVVAATWIATWLFSLALDAFPRLSGGAGGLVVTPSWSATTHYEIALALLALALLAHWALARSSFGLSLRAAATRPAAAATLGVEAPQLRLRAFAGAAAAAGLAGGFAVQLVGVADPGAYGPSLSFKLLVAVLVGGAASTLGPAVGMLLVASLSLVADALGRLTGAETARFGPMLAALLLLAVLTAGGDGLVPLVLQRLRRRGRGAPEPAPATPVRGAEVEVRDLTKRFGGLVALDRFGLRLDPGRTVALIGPNGSGKTTALRLLDGTMRPETGRIELAGADVTEESVAVRVRRGLVRTLQANAVFPGLTALENAVVGAAVRRRYGGAFRTLVATPKARREEREVRARALAALRTVGLEARHAVPAEELTTAEQRLLMLASALATSPRALLVDEPSAGAGAAELQRLTGVLRSLGEGGLALLVVEHNLRLVRSLADEVVVLDAGRRLASGTPDEIAEHPAVRAAYLGRQRL